jgi:DNA-binding transcriptional LysR family regulator
MDDKDWIILKTLYDQQNITKTAEKLYISQPALTYRIRQIEENYGTKVIVRGKKGVSFTSQGEFLVSVAIKMLEQLRHTKEKIKNMNNRVEGILRLGVSSNFALYKLPKILKSFLKEYPNVEIKVKTGWSSQIIDLLHKEDIHVGILRGEHIWNQQKHLLIEEPLYVVSKDIIRIEDLPFIGRIQYITDNHLHQTLDNWWRKTFVQPPLISMEVDKIETCKEMVKSGLGYAIFPGICLKSDDRLNQIVLKDNNNQVIKRPTWIMYKDSYLDLSIIKAFVDFTREMND